MYSGEKSYIKVTVISLLMILSLYCLISCKRDSAGNNRLREVKSGNSITNSTAINKQETDTGITEVKSAEIYGDTVWLTSYSTFNMTNTLDYGTYQAYVITEIDTGSYIVDTVITPLGNRLVIGYNHLYTIDILKDTKYWFTINFDKKVSLSSLLNEGDFWIDSNLDNINNVLFNEKYDQFIVELNMSTNSNFNLLFYLVVNSKGEITQKGRAGSSTMENEVLFPFITNDYEMYVTMEEIYSFKNSDAIPFKDFIEETGFKKNRRQLAAYSQIFALKPLFGKRFFAVFERQGSEPELNALILNTDTTVEGSFEYVGMVEEMDQVLLFESIPETRTSYLYDTDRKKLIELFQDDTLIIKEISIEDMVEVNGDTIPENNYSFIDFEAFGTYRFFITGSDSVIYYDIDRFD